MQIILPAMLALHILSAIFWAGSTVTLARIGGVEVDRMFRPQMGAALIAAVTGAALWHFFSGGAFGTAEAILAAGVLAAIAAAGVQGASIGAARRKLSGADPAESARLYAQMTTAQRIAAGLLVVTAICMAIARYV